MLSFSWLLPLLWSFFAHDLLLSFRWQFHTLTPFLLSLTFCSIFLSKISFLKLGFLRAHWSNLSVTHPRRYSDLSLSLEFSSCIAEYLQLNSDSLDDCFSQCSLQQLNSSFFDLLCLSKSSLASYILVLPRCFYFSFYHPSWLSWLAWATFHRSTSCNSGVSASQSSWNSRFTSLASSLSSASHPSSTTYPLHHKLEEICLNTLAFELSNTITPSYRSPKETPLSLYWTSVFVIWLLHRLCPASLAQERESCLWPPYLQYAQGR